MSKNNSEASEVKTMKRSLTNTHIQLIALGGNDWNWAFSRSWKQY
jgi:amino acid permease